MSLIGVRRWCVVLPAALVWMLPLPARAAPSASDAVVQKAEGGTITGKELETLKIESGSILPSEPAQIRAMNRVVATLRASVVGWSAALRAQRAEARIMVMLSQDGAHKVTLLDRPEGTAVLVDQNLMFALVLQDTAEGSAQAARVQAQLAASTLERVIAERHESEDLRSMLTSAAVAVLATLVLAALLRLLYLARRRAQAWLARKTEEHSKQWRLGGIELFSSQRLLAVEGLVVTLLFWLLVLLLIYQWLGVSLAQFPYTRVWAEQLNGFLFGVLARFALAVAGAIPDAFAATLIFALAYGAHKLIKRFFINVRLGIIQVEWLDADVAPITSRLCTTALWLFALAMAYPYLPGSDTDAFKGLSVLLGLMLSLGASNLVGQGASGLILTYTRALRAGEFVEVAGHEGTVMTLGVFTTRLRTGMGEELTISNSQVLGAVTKNYSRAVKGKGFIVDATVTIGYDTPWRQVHAMLIEAALATPGVVADPPPRVFQTALADYYPEYRLVCQAVPEKPLPRAEVMSLLHANIQDLFNEHGVQIMSPHYLGDPQTAKLVPREHWYDPPAKAPE